ncbi:AraC family transcriptional regulator [Variovorax sp. J22G21]|uniref:AraC family transcriptional regulator n=1 Tax=Variovorax fucosicus TaxID=3053517 RepID=UPI00257917E7|nr:MULTISPECIES: AraC family transcriptional regulator [unclassified Variovorax]MDM0039183.1 AraC family transcriptional regulator [Variovorax sp. J22R193]MDM0063959.1 AraC family transcriptional regulator [Variovorax sp. J22G21]
MTLTHHTVAIQQVHHILMGARHRGLDVAPLLARAGIAAPLLESPLARISQRQYALLIHALRREMRDEIWGLLSSPLPPGSFGQCMRQLVRCATLGEAMREGFAWYHLLLNDFVPRLSVQGDSAHVQFVLRRASDVRLDYAVKAFMLLGFNTFSWLVARRIPVLGVDYTAEQTGMDSSRVYQVPIRYGQPHVGLWFDARWLDLPVVQSQQSLREFLASSPANLIVRYRDTSSLTERIRRLLRKGLGADMPSLEAVGEALAVTPQTLRRRLREEGRGFQQIKDELRRDAAIDDLLHTQLPLLDIANRVGFSEASTFHRAFKQWTGVAPGEYRLAHGPER